MIGFFERFIFRMLVAMGYVPPPPPKKTYCGDPPPGVSLFAHRIAAAMRDEQIAEAVGDRNCRNCGAPPLDETGRCQFCGTQAPTKAVCYYRGCRVPEYAHGHFDHPFLSSPEIRMEFSPVTILQDIVFPLPTLTPGRKEFM